MLTCPIISDCFIFRMRVVHIQFSVIVGLLVLLVTCVRSAATAEFVLTGPQIKNERITSNGFAAPPGNYDIHQTVCRSKHLSLFPAVTMHLVTWLY